ncbi:UNVERIFIED_CONTAM: hypothetical protein GTU68_034662, partial [Idotea baltica]|nr:hypothetical protein [Idotea baltica]
MYKGSAITVQLLDGDIAEVNFDLQGESINKFNSLTIKELEEALEVIEKSDKIKGVLLTSSKSVFLVGADINEFVPLFGKSGGDASASHLSKNLDNFNRLEDLSVPTVIAINGYAMGGGLELALACDYRVMSTLAKIGLPETKLGIIPGWGGTVRLPRVAGADTAIEWIASGAEQRPDVALKTGVVDGVVEPDQLRDSALSLLQ